MSAEEFELLSSQDSDQVNDEEKDTNNNSNQISTDLISSDVQLVHSEPVSLAASFQSHTDQTDNTQIQQAIQSQFIHHLSENESSSSNEENHQNDSDDSNESDESDQSDQSDMNMEQTPPTFSQNEPIIVDQNHFSAKQDHEAKEEEEEDEEDDEEGIISPKEGIQNDIDNDNDDNDAPIVSAIHSTPNHDRKIYDNPYLNGSKSTPGAPDGEDGEESDDIDDDDEDIIPPHFTLKHDESDEEKDDVISDINNNNLEKEAIQQRQNDQILLQSVQKHNYNKSITLILISIIFAFIAYYIGYHRTTTTLPKPDPPKLHCPPSMIYVPLDGNPFYINASHKDHPDITWYEWDIEDIMNHTDLFVDGENSANLLLMKGTLSEVIHIDLYISSTINHYVFNKQCSMNVMFHEIPYFGIDLGTTYSCIAYQNRQSGERETKIIVVDEHRAEHCIPTAVYYDVEGRVIIGEDALKKLASDPLNVIFDIKRIIGRDCSDSEIESFNKTHEFNVICNDNNNIQIFVPNLNDYIYPEQSLSVILSHLVEIASSEFGVPYLRDIVVSIPALFHNGQRKAILSATELVGLKVKQLVVEPTAAALAHSYYSSTPSDNFKLFLTFDFGGGTLDCSVLRCSGVDCEVIGVKGNSTLGGIDFDHVIKDIMINKYEQLHGWFNVRSSDKLKAKFLKVAERVKKSLSVSTEHRVIMTNDELLNTEKKEIVITRKEFEEDHQTKELIDSAIQTASDAINNERIKESNIRMILMIGGTTKIPIIEKRLKQEFGYKNRLKLVFPSDDPQLMVVKGSAIIGASMAFDGDNTNKEIVLEDVIPLPLGFSICLTNYNDSSNTKCGIMDVIIDKNSHYPTKANVIYCQKEPLSSIAKLDLYEGDDEFVINNYLLSHLSINGIPKRDKNICDSIIVEFIIDKNGIANIEAIINDDNKTSFKKKLSVVSNDANLSKKDILTLKKKMIKWFKGHNDIQNALKQ